MKKFFRVLSIVFIIFVGSLLIVIMTVPSIRSQIVSVSGLAVAQTTTQWNNVKDAAQGDNLTSGLPATALYGFDGTNWDRLTSTGGALNINGTFTLPVSSLLTLLNAEAAPITGATNDLGFVLSKMTWEIDQTGGSGITINLQGSIDGTNFYNLDNVTLISADEMRHVVNKPIRYVRADLTAIAGGTVTVRYIGGGN